MKTLVIYYSLTGKTEKAAREQAALLGADILALRDEKKQTLLRAFLLGCPAAIKGRPAKLAAFPYTLEEYDALLIAMPVWAGNPAPAFNNIAAVLPKGKTVTLLMVSASGNTAKSRERSVKLVEGRGCTVREYRDIATGK